MLGPTTTSQRLILHWKKWQLMLFSICSTQEASIWPPHFILLSIWSKFTPQKWFLKRLSPRANIIKKISPSNWIFFASSTNESQVKLLLVWKFAWSGSNEATTTTTMVVWASLEARARTGSDYSGSGRARAFGFRAWVGLGLRNTWLSGSDSLCFLHNKSFLCNFRVSGLDGLDQKSGLGFSGYWAYVVRAQHWARANGHGPRLVPALLESAEPRRVEYNGSVSTSDETGLALFSVLRLSWFFLGSELQTTFSINFRCLELQTLFRFNVDQGSLI